MGRTVAQLAELLDRQGVELAGSTPEARVSCWLRGVPARHVDHHAPGHSVHSVELGEVGVQVSARYDWDAGRFVVRDWWTYNA